MQAVAFGIIGLKFYLAKSNEVHEAVWRQVSYSHVRGLFYRFLNFLLLELLICHDSMVPQNKKDSFSRRRLYSVQFGDAGQHWEDNTW